MCYYSREQTKHIIDAYRNVFAGADDFLDFIYAIRPYNCIQTDFRNDNYNYDYFLDHPTEHSINNINSFLANHNANEANIRFALDEQFDLYKNNHLNGVGMSIGINSYCDDLLLRTYDKNKPDKHILLLLFHNYYPVIFNKKNGQMYHELKNPLTRYSILDSENPYNHFRYVFDNVAHSVWHSKKTSPEIFSRFVDLFHNLENRYTIVFLNLFPDYLPPLEEVAAGRITPNIFLQTGITNYATCVNHLFEFINVRQNSNLQIAKILCFGKPVYDEIHGNAHVHEDIVEYYYHPSSRPVQNHYFWNQNLDNHAELGGIAQFMEHFGAQIINH